MVHIVQVIRSLRERRIIGDTKRHLFSGYWEKTNGKTDVSISERTWKIIIYSWTCVKNTSKVFVAVYFVRVLEICALFDEES
jgi:hypothetical protein